MSSSTTPSSPIYLDVGLALAQIGDPDAVRGILVMVEESLQRDIPAIAHLLAAGDVQGANALLHPLKGFIPIFCREALCEHVGKVEGLSKNGSSTDVGRAYAVLQPELEQLLAEVSRYLKTP
jgi:HPt (histidine-containing phosphotransfer) domain-containing protein